MDATESSTHEHERTRQSRQLFFVVTYSLSKVVICIRIALYNARYQRFIMYDIMYCKHNI